MKQLAYLGVYELKNNAYAGGFLVCDDRGLPVDFRYVDPVFPTKMQTLIYGDALRRYIMVEAIGAGLLRESEANYRAAFVGDPMLLELAGRCKAPMVLIEKGMNSQLLKRTEWKRLEKGGVIYQAVDGMPPVKLSFPGAENGYAETLIRDLTELPDTFDLLEPLDRVKIAVTEIGSSKDEARQVAVS